MSTKLIYMTATDTDEAFRISEALVAENLIACANVLGAMQSVYRWEGAVQRGEEVAVLLKTREELVEQVLARAAALHSYDCPCLIVLDVTGGHAPFLGWIQTETGAEDE
ncbi:MAG: divalent-cation tolerance protein CutA [Rhodospirillales bacterium]